MFSAGKLYFVVTGKLQNHAGNLLVKPSKDVSQISTNHVIKVLIRMMFDSLIHKKIDY